jgi:hypothetical protein
MASVEFKYNVDGAVKKTKLSVYEDGRDESFLKLIKEFQNYVDTYELWEVDNAACTVYRTFQRCLAGAARDLKRLFEEHFQAGKNVSQAVDEPDQEHQLLLTIDATKGRSFSKEDLIAEVISKNIPAAWEKNFTLHLKTKIKDILSKLTVKEEKIKTHPKNNENPNKKNIKSPLQNPWQLMG